jgi:hypothetical protein
VLVCTDKPRGNTICTARMLVSNCGPLLIEQTINLPEAMTGHARAEIARLGFGDLDAEGRSVPLAHAGGMPHRVLVFDSMTAERTWHTAKNGLYAFMIDTLHPDIDLFATAAPSVLLEQQAHVGRAVEPERGAGGAEPGQPLGQRRVFAGGGREFTEQAEHRLGEAFVVGA